MNFIRGWEKDSKIGLVIMVLPELVRVAPPEQPDSINPI